MKAKCKCGCLFEASWYYLDSVGPKCHDCYEKERSNLPSDQQPCHVVVAEKGKEEVLKTGRDIPLNPEVT